MRISDWSSDVCSSDLLLGNLWYDKRQYDDAISCWERSVAENQEFPTAHRNLSLAWHNKRNDRVRALASLEKAFDLDREDARVLMELDQLRSEEHTSELQSLMRISYAVFCLKTTTNKTDTQYTNN